jgi:putative peptidoglycan lipid II flippase
MAKTVAPHPGEEAQVFKKQTIRGASWVLGGVALLRLALRFFVVLLIARRFGVGREADIYFLAQAIPVGLATSNRQLINYAFVPVFTEYNIERGEDEAWRMASVTMNLSMMTLVAFTVLYFLLAPLLFELVAPGFSSGDRARAIELSRLVSPVLIFFGLFAFCEGILYSRNHYTTTSLSTLFVSLGTLLGVIFLADSLGIFGVGLGLLGGYILQAVIPLVPFRHYRKRLSLIMDWGHHGFRKFYLQIPNILWIQLCIVVIVVTDFTLATTLGPGSVSAFQYCSTITGVIPVVVQTALLGPIYPRISEKLVNGEFEELKGMLRAYFRAVSFFVIPVTVGIMILRVPIVALLLQRGNFTVEATELTAHVLLFTAPSMGLVPLSTIFYLVFLAKNRARLLAMTAAIFVVSNFCLCWVLMQFLGLAGIALGTTLLNVVQIFVCGYLVQKEIGNLGMRELVMPIVKILVAVLLAAFCLLAGLHLSAGLEIAEKGFFPLARLCVLVLIGAMAYLLAGYVFRIEEIGSGLERIRNPK